MSENKKVEEPKKFDETKKKSQSVNILVSHYSYKDKVVSAIGIQNESMVISHVIRKRDIPPESWFKVLQAISANPDFTDGQKKDLEKTILEDSKEIVVFPFQMARIIKTLGDLVHKIETVKVEF